MKILKHIFIISFFLLSFQLFSQTKPLDNEIRISEDVCLIKLSENTFVHKSYITLPEWGRIGGNGLIYINSHDAIIVNTPWNDSLASILCNYVEDSLHVKIKYLVATHSHADCMGGLSEFKKRGITSYSLLKTLNIAKQQNLPLPDITFTDTLTIKLNNTSVLLYYPGGGHTIDNIVVWIPTEKVLFGGCLIKDASSQNLGNTKEAVIDKWPYSVKLVSEKFPDSRIIVPGHGDFGGKNLLIHTLDLLKKSN